MDAFLEVAVETAREAGAILLEEFARPVKISYKGEVDIVTQADKRSERTQSFPACATTFPSTPLWPRRAAGRKASSPFRWHVDPLDGTTNFAHGYPCFCVSLGLEEAGEPIVGVIYQPVSGELFTAVKGEGAYLNQKKIEESHGSIRCRPVC